MLLAYSEIVWCELARCQTPLPTSDFEKVRVSANWITSRPRWPSLIEPRYEGESNGMVLSQRYSATGRTGARAGGSRASAARGPWASWRSGRPAAGRLLPSHWACRRGRTRGGLRLGLQQASRGGRLPGGALMPP